MEKPLLEQLVNNSCRHDRVSVHVFGLTATWASGNIVMCIGGKPRGPRLFGGELASAKHPLEVSIPYPPERAVC